MLEIIPLIAAVLVWLFVFCMGIGLVFALSDLTRDWWFGPSLFVHMVASLTLISLSSLLAVLTYVWLAGVV